jgi:hypothetical protein
MTEQATSRPSARMPRPRRSVRRTVLSLTAAATVAVSLPFSALYIQALNQHAAAVTASRIVHVGAAPGHTTVTTRASGSVATSSPAQAAGPGSVSAPTTVTTRAS